MVSLGPSLTTPLGGGLFCAPSGGRGCCVPPAGGGGRSFVLEEVSLEAGSNEGGGVSGTQPMSPVSRRKKEPCMKSSNTAKRIETI